MKFFNSKNKTISLALLIVMIFSFCNVAPAKAQFGPGYPTYDLKADFNSLWDRYQAQIEKAANKVESSFVDSVMMGAMKGFEYLTNKISYDLAVSMASGNWGQSPLFQTKNMGDYLAGVAGDAIGTALDSFGNGIGFNLCTLPDVKLDLALKLGLRTSYAAPKPTCTWQQLKESYSASGIKSKYWGENGNNFAKNFNASIEVSQTDIGIGVEAKAKIDQYAVNAEANAKADREEGGGAKSLSTIISGGIITPAKINLDTITGLSPAKRAEKQEANTAAYMSAALQKGSVQVLMNAASTFIEAFAGATINNFLTKGMFPLGLGKIKCVPSYLKIGGLSIDTCVETKYDAEGNYYGGGESTYRQEAVSLFTELLLITKTKEVTNYDLLAKFSSCPDEPGIENCVLDEDFAKAVRSADLGNPLTISQAITKEYLHYGWKLIGPGEKTERQHGEKDCYNGAYCYKNLKLLRKAGVLPLGFEIAALTQTATATAPTLDDVIKNFNNSSSPYYHLVNPNWVLKIPPTRCKSLVYGTHLAAEDTPIRQEECVDLQSCVSYDKNGKCIAYGYCLKEKSVWRFDADYCDNQYATCKTLTNSSGDSSSYLARTLNSEMCDPENTGCLFYSNDKSYVNNNFASSTWKAPSKPNATTQPGYFLNKKVTACDSENAGCTAFTTNTLTSATLLYFKKAPDYLGCYDSDRSVAGIQWPENWADFNKIRPVSKDECDNYSKVCLPEEENCARYNTLKSDGSQSGETIIGKFTPAEIVGNEVVWHDQCSSTCVGYAAYKEMPNKYANGNSLTYIVPKSEAECTVSDVGCSAFVNLSTTQNNQEQTEYYTDLRLCSLPDKNKQKNFYTYEGKDDAGYQLRSFVFLKDETGAPKQIYRDNDEQTKMINSCNSASLSDDCREFIDDTGKKYYAFLSKTVVVSDSCTPYRLVNPEFYNSNDGNVHCLGSANDSTGAVVRYDSSGYCIYYGLPQGVSASAESSKDCNAERVSCREYKGNTGNYVANVLPDGNFEGRYTFNANNVSSTWGIGMSNDTNPAVLTISTESLINGEHSLKVVTKAGSQISTGIKRYNLSMTAGKIYSVSFYAKGKGTWGLRFWHILNNNPGDFTLTDNWHRYEYTFTASSSANAASLTGGAQMVFKPGANVDQLLYLDNVSVQEVSDIKYLVKNKLSLSNVCDADQTDNLPGVALGCRAYVDGNKTKVYLHNFSYLCRDGAVGCTAVYDTNNREIADSDAENTLVYNLWFSKTAFGESGDYKGYLTDTTTVSGVELKCFTAKDEDGCYVKKISFSKSLLFPNLAPYYTSSTIISSPKGNNFFGTPIYLVLDSNSSCAAANKGCTALGSSVVNPDGSRSYTDVYAMINPGMDEFDSAVCNDKSEGCETWKSDSASYYYKDPKVYGNRLCEWTKDNSGSYNWMLQSASGTPCGDYLPSFGTDNYNNYVGTCPADQSGCTLYADRYTESQSKKCSISGQKCQFDKDCTGDPEDLCTDPDKEYYLINNTKITDTQTDCGGKVSLQSGCVLFDQTDNPTKSSDTSATYESSERQGGISVDPISSDSNDANIVMKVKLDRECSLWAYCSDYMTNRDVDTGQLTSRCYRLGLCDKAQAGATSDGQCAAPVSIAQTPGKNIPLTKEVYQNRSTKWNAEEFSGYSLFNAYQIYDLQVRDLAFNKALKAKSMLVHVEENTSTCARTDIIADKVPCGVSQEGYCLGTECIYPAKPYLETDLENTDYLKIDTEIDAAPILTCRGYPEKDSPFDPWILNDYFSTGTLKVFKESNPKFTDAVNLCTIIGTSTDKGCDCNYKKYVYNAKTAYFGNNVVTGDFEKGICIGGLNEGIACNPYDCMDSVNEDCACIQGTCTPLKSKTALLGWEGYCVEKDGRYPLYTKNGTENTCLTWWPVESVEGATDLWVYDETAGWETTSKNIDRKICAYNTPVNGRSNKNDGVQDFGSHFVWNYDEDLFQNGTEDVWRPYSFTGDSLDFDAPCVVGSVHNLTCELFRQLNSNFSFSGESFGNIDQVLVNNAITNLPDNAEAFVYPVNLGMLKTEYSAEFLIVPSSTHPVINKDNLVKIDFLTSEDTISNKEGEDSNMIFGRNKFTFLNKEVTGCVNPDYDVDSYASLEVNGGKDFCFEYARGVQQNSNFKVTSTVKIGGNGTKYNVWQMKLAETPSPGKSEIFPYIFENDSNSIIKDNFAHYSLEEDDGEDYDEKGSGEDKDGYGIEVVFEKSTGNLKGFVVDIVDGREDTYWGGVIAVVHYTDGICGLDQTLTVSDETQKAKPVTWRLKKDKVNLRVANATWKKVEETIGGETVSGLVNSSSPSGEARMYDRKVTLPNIFGLFGNAVKGLNLNSFRFTYQGDGGETITTRLSRFAKRAAGVALFNFDFRSLSINSYLSDEIKTEVSNLPVVNFLKKMFTKFAVNNTPVDVSSPQTAFKLGVTIRPPIIAAPTKLSTLGCAAKKQLCNNADASQNKLGCEASKVCNSFVLNQMSITGDNLVGDDKHMSSGQPLILRFYAWADPAQMPLTRILVKKGLVGDTNENPISLSADSIGNRKPKCTSFGYCGANGSNWNVAAADKYKYQIPCDGNWDCVFYDGQSNLVSGKCIPFTPNPDDPEGYGNKTGEGCTASYYEFYLNVNNPGTYKPAVQVLDNWGWCNGNCNTSYYPTGYKGIGCYADDIDGNGTNDCQPGNTLPWKEYSGNVVVK